jgi:hypothetical protein
MRRAREIEIENLINERIESLREGIADLRKEMRLGIRQDYGNVRFYYVREVVKKLLDFLGLELNEIPAISGRVEIKKKVKGGRTR